MSEIKIHGDVIVNMDELNGVAEAIPAEVGKVCDPYDGEQEAFENDIGSGNVNPNFENDVVATNEIILPNGEVVIPDIPTGDDLTTTIEDEFVFEELTPFLQDGVAAIMNEVVGKYVFIRDNYDFTNREDTVNSIVSKLLPIVADRINYNNYMEKDIANVITTTIANHYADILTSGEKSFTLDNFTKLSDDIIDKLIDNDISDLVTSYKCQLKHQLNTMVIPNYMEDIAIYFNTPPIDLTAGLENISQQQPDARKYKIVKNNDSLYSVLLWNEAGDMLKVKYEISFNSTGIEEEQEIEITLIGSVVEEEELQTLVAMYEDSTRWKAVEEK